MNFMSSHTVANSFFRLNKSDLTFRLRIDMTSLNQRLSLRPWNDTQNGIFVSVSIPFAEMISLCFVATLHAIRSSIAKSMEAFRSKFRIESANVISHIDPVWYHGIRELNIFTSRIAVAVYEAYRLIRRFLIIKSLPAYPSEKLPAGITAIFISWKPPGSLSVLLGEESRI